MLVLDVAIVKLLNVDKSEKSSENGTENAPPAKIPGEFYEELSVSL